MPETETTADQELVEEVPSADMAIDQELQELRSRLEEQKQEAADNYEKYLRTIADLDNVRKRARQEKQDAAQFGTQELLRALLPVVDNFERALEAATATNNRENLLQGVQMILRQMQDVLAKQGITPINAAGEKFDPALHEAVLQAAPDESHPPGTVVEEIQKGYKLHGRVLRPAHVKVAHDG